MLELALLLGCTVGVQVGNPELLRGFIDGVGGGKSLPFLLIDGGPFFVLVLVNQRLVVATAFLGSNLAWRTTNHMRLDMAFHHAHTPGELIERTCTLAGCVWFLEMLNHSGTQLFQTA